MTCKPKRNRYLQTLFLICLLSITALGQRTRWCGQELDEDFPITAPIGIPLAFSDFVFGSADDHSGGLVTIKNLDVRRIDALLIIFELTDGNGQHILSMPVYFQRHGEPKLKFRYMEWVEAHAVSGDEILPQDRDRLGFRGPLIPDRCPVAARVSFAEIVYADKAHLEFGSSNPYIDPILVRAQQVRVGEVALPTLTAAGIVTLDGEGNPVDVTFRTELKEAVAERIVQQIKTGWRFSPAPSDNGLRSYTWQFVVVFSPVDAGYKLREEDVDLATTLISALPRRDAPIEIVGVKPSLQSKEFWEVRWASYNTGVGGLKPAEE